MRLVETNTYSKESREKNNGLATTGVYVLVRNPISSAFMPACTGELRISGDLFFRPMFVSYWIFMTVLMKCTKEKRPVLFIERLCLERYEVQV